MFRANKFISSEVISNVRSLTTRKKYPKPLRTRKSGIDILHDPLWNKSLAFSYSERDRLGIRGLIPPAVRTIEGQVMRCMEHLRSCADDAAKNLYLQDLHNRNETLYHRLLVDFIEEIAPLVYTPTVGVVCQQFGHRFNRARGMYFSLNDRGAFSTMVYNWPHDDVHVIVVTDGSRILGLGDLGAHGMGIPIGKLALYCAAGGIAPHRVLPITLDVGTNNPELLKDPSYVGIQKNRLVGDEYFDFVDEFMQAVAGRWPNAVIQFEDFETAKAVPLLEKYRNMYHCFNDDIQGTGCVTLAGIIAAARAAKGTISDMRFMVVGAGSAGLGVCAQILDGLRNEGLSTEEARKKFVVFSHKGVLGKKDGVHGSPHHSSETSPEMLEWVNDDFSDGDKLLDVIHKFKPTVLLGLSTQGGLFNEEVVKAMHQHCPNPIIMPMSNPTSKAECTAADAYKWTNGAAIVASGSPFPSVTLPDGTVKIPSQCNNMYIFPGLGLAASVGGIERITDRMLYTAAVACADAMTPQCFAEGRTFPNIKNIREVSLQVATAIVKVALEEDLCRKIDPEDVTDDEWIRNFIARKMYFPSYVPLL
eukprot:CAMPEP_0184978344 /NCGR_PEP_ID=MMETSP1098-20130426/8864_1 /TAXON_ID=89044 /ORGANISM="Spumella elongata, Strain CCAP 955/1" /LENGTH=587 /DNA_ID=CAMNT_0027501465 /DNA_START=49 /DNA_END=1812 /DNA_ORIENTATION=+